MNGSTVERLLAEAAAFVEQYEYQAAVDKFHEAYQLEPDNTMVLDNLSEVLLEIGQVDDALNISLRPTIDLQSSFSLEVQCVGLCVTR
jgi:thioredoxin-like negative regulator of GroEL